MENSTNSTGKTSFDNGRNGENKVAQVPFYNYGYFPIMSYPIMGSPGIIPIIPHTQQQQQPYLFRMPEIFPFNIDFGDFSRSELNKILPSNTCISWYSAWNELRTGKRSHLYINSSENNVKISNIILKRVSPSKALFSVGYPNEVMVVSTSTEPTPSSSSQNSPIRTNDSSWASLFHTNNNNNSNSNNNNKISVQNKEAIEMKSDAFFDFHVDYERHLFIPRGLVNRGNMCFMNATLQALVHCAPFFNFLLFSAIHIRHSIGKSVTPLIDALIMFIREFREEDENDATDALDTSNPLLPEYVYETIMQDDRFKRGRQEDAEEFLGFLLDGIHEELITHVCPQPPSYKSEESSSESEWVEVGQKNKTVITRNLEFRESAITNIFGGRIRSIIKCPGQKDSVTIEPYHSLQLDISHEDTKSVMDALVHLSKPEVIYGYGSTGTEATKQILIETLPPVLILHLKRFVFQDNETQKLHKHVNYSLDLNIPRDILSTQLTSADSKLLHYKLFGIVYHHGKNAADGHYTCDTCRANDEWLSFDDTMISKISDTQVIEDKSKDKCAYILFYIRVY